MTISDVKNILSAEIICGEEHINKDVTTAFGSDMMSDVLAFAKDQCLLLTGLCNPQVIRTAEMLDMICICFVRGKKPDDDMIALAKERGIVLMATEERMFATCGKLYEKGLRGGESK